MWSKCLLGRRMEGDMRQSLRCSLRSRIRNRVTGWGSRLTRRWIRQIVLPGRRRWYRSQWMSIGMSALTLSCGSSSAVLALLSLSA